MKEFTFTVRVTNLPDDAKVFSVAGNINLCVTDVLREEYRDAFVTVAWDDYVTSPPAKEVS